jgi:putative heme-binding domain-containing protein
MKFAPSRATNALLLACFLLSGNALLRAEDANRTAIALEALSRLKGIDLDSNPGVKKAVVKLLDQARGTPQFVEIVRDFKFKDQDPALLEIAIQNPASSIGADAMRLILGGQNVDLVKQALAGTNAVVVTEALGNTGAQEIVPLLLPIVTNSAREVAVRQQAVRSLAQVQTGADALLKLAEERALPADLTLTATMALSNLRWEDLRTRAAQILPPPQARDAQPLPPIAELVKLNGDPTNGAKVFRSEAVGCNKCHQVNGEGIDFGPALSEIGTKLGKDALYEAILNPSAGISFGFEAWQINLKNGDDAFGLIASETTDELAIKATGGIVTRYKKSDIASRAKQKLSIMPSGLQQAMTRQDLVDLVEYLSSLKKAQK